MVNDCGYTSSTIISKNLPVAIVAAALADALAAIAAIPTSDYSTDGDAAELVRRDDAADIVRAAMAKLGITE